MSRPPEQQNTTSPRRWVRLCQWLFRGLLFIWATVVLGLASNVGATWLTTKGFDPAGTPLGWIIQHPPVALACGGILLVLTIVSGVLGRQDESFDSHPLLSPPTQENRPALIHLLRKEYHRQITESLGEVTKMALALQWRRDVTLSSVSSVSWRMDALDDHSSSAPASIVQAYDDAGAGLLILGASGAGKSTLLRELASELLTQADDDATKPIPVIVNLSSWAIKQPPLTAWMVDRLWETYNIPPRLSQALIEQNQLLFLLDGLDEMELSARTKCIEAINTYLAEQKRIVPIVVCARSHAYLEQEERLRVPIAVEVRPLTLEQVNGYLKQVGKSLAAVRAALRSNGVLRDLVTTPLMLNVVRSAYHGKTVKDLPQLGSAEDQQRQVFAHYVTRMLEQQTRKWRYTPDSTQKWVIWLAQQMKQRQLTEFYLERLQPTWLSTKRPRIVYALISGLSVGLPFELLIGLLGGLLGRLSGELLVGLLGGLLGGLLIALLGGLAGWLGRLNREKVPQSWRRSQRGLISWDVREHWEIRPAEKLTWSWRRFWRGLIPEGLAYGGLVELLGGLAGGLVGGLSGELLVGLLGGLLGGLLVGLAGGLFFGLAGGLSNEQIDEHERLRPNQGIRTSGWNALRSGLGSGLLIGLAAGLLGGLLGGLLIGLIAGPVGGLLFGLVFGLDYGGIAYLQHYSLRCLLWRSGVIPWCYVRFLEEARERILLQRVGGGYRFIHPLFLDYFASLGTPVSPPSVQPPPSRQ